MEQITETRIATLRNGYVPLPNIDKRCHLEGWPKIDVTEEVVFGWQRVQGWQATGIRVEGGLAVIDLDLDVDDFAELAIDLRTKFPQLANALRRTGKGEKQAWYVRTSEVFSRIGSATFIDPNGDPEVGFRIEIFGGGSARQFGSFGWHTENELEYSWVEQKSPENTPLVDLPEMAKKDFFQITDFVTEWMEQHGYQVLTTDSAGETVAHRVYDLTDDMVFVTQDGDDLNLEQLRDAGDNRCSASFCEGPTAANTTRCLVGIDHQGGVSIWDTMTCTTHHEKRLEPADLGQIGREAFNALRNLETGSPHEPEPDTMPLPAIEFTRTNGGAIAQNETNAALALATAPEWSGVLAINEMDSQPWVMARLPGDTRSNLTFPRPMEDADDFYVLTWLQRHGADGHMASLSASKANMAAMALACQASFNPVRDYLDGLKWDGTDRLSTWLAGFAGVNTASKQERAYIQGVARKWMISAVARVFDPGCKADQVLILQGPQGVGKSSLLRILAGQWFAEDLPNVSQKDAQQYLGDSWIIEMAELASVRGAAVESVKAFMSRQVDKYRIPYGKKMTNQKRRCVFAGTTNAESFLLDPTGNRRYWPVKVGQIDLAGLKDIRDQLWAEAVVAHHAGETWHFDRDQDADAILGALEAQGAAYVQNPDEGKVRDWLRNQKGNVTMRQIDEGVFREAGDLRRPTDKRLVHDLTEMLPRLGWHKGTIRKGLQTYARGPEAEPYAPKRNKQPGGQSKAIRGHKLALETINGSDD